MKKYIIPLLFIATCFVSSAEEPKHLLVAKFALKRLEKAELTDQQKAAFNKLSGDLRKEIDALRKEVGIDKEVMGRRDKAHQKLKTLKLEKSEYWSRLQSDASLNDAQLQAFKTTAEKFTEFKAAVNAFLTKEQQALTRSKGAKKSK